MKPIRSIKDRAAAYMQKRMRQEGATDYGFSPHDIRLFPGWLRKAWLAGYRAGKRDGVTK